MNPRRILCFGDSNTFGWTGVLSGPALRFPECVRWTGRLRRMMPEAEIIEEGLGGRTVSHDFVVGAGTRIPGAGLSGEAYLPACLLSHLPLDLVIIMLGSNDLKSALGLSAREIAAGIGRLADIVRSRFWKDLLDYPAPRVLLVSPPFIGGRKMDLAGERYACAPERSRRLPALYAEEARRTGSSFLAASGALADAAAPGEAHGPDGMHLDENDHKNLAEALLRHIRSMA